MGEVPLGHVAALVQGRDQEHGRRLHLLLQRGPPAAGQRGHEPEQYEPDANWGPQNPTSGTPKPNRTHQVQVGDTLDRISARYYGDSTQWRAIAGANGIADPFDSRVVDAYWIGNSLLDHVEVRQLYDSLLERFGKQLQGRTRDYVLGKAPAGARPHHSFHVLDVHSRVGDFGQTLPTMDHCRVSWGTVVEVDCGELVVDRVPLVLIGGKLVLGDPVRERVVRQIEGRGFVEDAAEGDAVSVHWGWACEVLSADQSARLERYTRHHLAIANQTI